MKIRTVLKSKLLNFGCAGCSYRQAAQFVGYNYFLQITLRRTFRYRETEQFFSLWWSRQCHQNVVGNSDSYSLLIYHLIV